MKRSALSVQATSTPYKSVILKNVVRLGLMVLLMGWGECVLGQNVNATWGANSNSAWYTGGNWAGGTYPGLQGAASSNTNIATYTSAFTGTTVGINMGTNSLNLGAISNDNTRTTALNVGNSSATGGVLRLYGSTVNSVSNVVSRNNGTGLFTIQAAQNGTLGLVLSNATENIFQIDNIGGITVSSIISDLSGNRNLTKGGSGAGILLLTGANTYSGLTTVNAGTLQLNRAGGTTIPSTNNVTVNGGTLRISSNQTLNNLTIASGATVSIDLNVTLTINGTLDMGNTAIISGSGNLTIGAAASVKIGSTLGLTSAAGQGNVQVSGTRTYPSTAVYEYNNSMPSTQSTGDQLPATVGQLTINNTVGVTLTNSVTTTTVLAFTNGILATGANTMTIA